MFGQDMHNSIDHNYRNSKKDLANHTPKDVHGLIRRIELVDGDELITHERDIPHGYGILISRGGSVEKDSAHVIFPKGRQMALDDEDRHPDETLLEIFAVLDHEVGLVVSRGKPENTWAIHPLKDEGVNKIYRMPLWPGVFLEMFFGENEDDLKALVSLYDNLQSSNLDFFKVI
jgi:hypothetical protein